MKAEFTIKDGLLGDSCWPEPALTALGEQRGEPVRVFVGQEAVRPLYANLEHIVVADEPGGPVIDESRAWHWAIDHSRYFAEGFFEQVGASLDGARKHVNFNIETYTTIDEIVICPFSASCGGSHGKAPNKTMELAWWEELVKVIAPIALKAKLPIVTLGSKSQSGIPGTVFVRGSALPHAARTILSCKILITVETWAAVIAGSKRLGNALILNSATPPSLHFSPYMAEFGHRYYREEHPWDWDFGRIEQLVHGFIGE